MDYLSSLKNFTRDLFEEIDGKSLFDIEEENFDLILKNQKEMYFIKHFSSLDDFDCIYELENLIAEYQNEIRTNDIIYNFNYVLLVSKVDEFLRKKLEQDKHTSRKIIIDISNKDTFEKDLELLPFYKKHFRTGAIGGNAEELILGKCKNIIKAREIVSILSKDIFDEEDIENIIDLV